MANERTRARNLVVRLADDELAMAHALADDEREPVAVLVRRWIRQHHVARFGNVAPAPSRRLDPATERAVDALLKQEPKRRRRRAVAG